MSGSDDCEFALRHISIYVMNYCRAGVARNAGQAKDLPHKLQGDDEWIFLPGGELSAQIVKRICLMDGNIISAFFHSGKNEFFPKQHFILLLSDARKSRYL